MNMRVLRDSFDVGFSCGITTLTGFGYECWGERLENIKADLRDCNGFRNKYTVKTTRWTGDQYVPVEETRFTRPCAIVLVSLNAGQCKFWKPILLEHGYKEVVSSIRNPNSGNRIRVFALTRAKRNPKSQKKEKRS
jgi:hypothetical protein